jgi:ribonucleoside-diphosphate reductase alpha chain
VPTDYKYEDFKDIYKYAYEQGLKGCTTFRFNPEAFQGVLVKEDDLKNTTYVFTLEDGTEVEATGDQEIEYDGEMHTAANLFDALKEGYYGKF